MLRGLFLAAPSYVMTAFPLCNEGIFLSLLEWKYLCLREDIYQISGGGPSLHRVLTSFPVLECEIPSVRIFAPHCT